MATYVPTVGSITRYQDGNHFPSGTVRITNITDGDNSNQEFTTSDTNVTLTFANGAVSPGWDYLGTTNAIAGGPYLVFQNTLSGTTWTYVVGTGVTKTPGQTLGSGEKTAPATVGGSNGLNIDNSAFTVCFFPGTLIATPDGERKVEDLVSGDRVLIEDFGAVPATWAGHMARELRRNLGFGRAVPVKWIGRQTVSSLFGSAERLMPVRFSAGSLGGGGATPSAT